MWPTKALLAVLLLALPAVHAEEEPKQAAPQSSTASEEMAERAARGSSRDVKVPRALVHQLESEYRTFLTKNEVSTKTNINRKLLNLTVELTQKHPVALHENTRVLTPLGGGVVDLADFVTPLKGGFSLKILAKKEDGSDPSGLRMFFVSKAKTRRLDGDDFGAGCNKFMEITSYYHRKGGGRGFDLYTAGQRYLSVVGGTFVAVEFEKDAMQVGSLTFLDSRYPEVTCE
jgi:hypothetical protein